MKNIHRVNSEIYITDDSDIEEEDYLIENFTNQRGLTAEYLIQFKNK